MTNSVRVFQYESACFVNKMPIMTVTVLVVHFSVLTFSLPFFTRFVFPGLTFLAVLRPQALTTPFFHDRVGSEAYVNA